MPEQQSPRNTQAPKDNVSSKRKPQIPGKIWLWFLGILLLNYVISNVLYPEKEL